MNTSTFYFLFYVSVLFHPVQNHIFLAFSQGQFARARSSLLTRITTYSSTWSSFKVKLSILKKNVCFSSPLHLVINYNLVTHRLVSLSLYSANWSPFCERLLKGCLENPNSKANSSEQRIVPNSTNTLKQCQQWRTVAKSTKY